MRCILNVHRTLVHRMKSNDRDWWKEFSLNHINLRQNGLHLCNFHNINFLKFQSLLRISSILPSIHHKIFEFNCFFAHKLAHLIFYSQ